MCLENKENLLNAFLYNQMIGKLFSFNSITMVENSRAKYYKESNFTFWKSMAKANDTLQMDAFSYM